MIFTSRPSLNVPASCSTAPPGTSRSEQALEPTRFYSATPGPPPPGIAELGPDVWRGDTPPAERGFLALGTRIGTHEFVAAASEARLGEAQRLPNEIVELPDLQSSWLLLLQSDPAPLAVGRLRKGPRCRHLAHAAAVSGAAWRRRGRAGPGTPTGLPLRTARRPVQAGNLKLSGALATTCSASKSSKFVKGTWSAIHCP